MTLHKVWLFLVALCSAVWAEPVLSVSGNAYQGSALFVRVLGEDGKSPPMATWEGKKWTLDAAEQGWETVLPVGIDTRGQQELRVTLADETVLQPRLRRSHRN